jgi:hypothetical protein
MVGQGCQLCGVAPQSLHLVHREDHPAVRGVGLDLPGGGERGLEVRTDPDPGADLLGKDLVAGDVLGGESVELGLEFLSEGRAARVSDADVRARGVRVDGRGRRGARPPRLAGAAVGGGRHCLGPLSSESEL